MHVIHALRKAAVGILSAGTTVLMAACYGPSDYLSTPELLIGKVLFDQTGVPGLQVCLTAPGVDGETAALVQCGLTGQGGGVRITGPGEFVTQAGEGGVEICVTDIDGAANGTFADQCETVAAPLFPMVRVIELDNE